MKRSLILVPIILLVILNACGSNQAQMAIIVHQTDTAAAVATLTATNMPPTATPFPTIDPNEQQIVNLMNALGVQYQDGFDGGSFGDPMFQTKLDQLENFMGADFIVFDAAFPPGENNMLTLFQINARCECGTNRPCCTAERMFILTMRELFLNRDYVMGQVPTTVQTMQLLCFDHGRLIATISAAWQDVQSFLYGNLNGLQFGSRITVVP
jgi:hypothetical protein